MHGGMASVPFPLNDLTRQSASLQIGPSFSSSVGAIIHRLCTDQLIRAGLRDKIQTHGLLSLLLTRQRTATYGKGAVMRMGLVLSVGAIAAITAGCANNPLTQSPAERDYKELSGTWQLTRAVVNSRRVPPSVLRKTILITDHNTFRFPKASGVGTHPAGRFTVNPTTRPKQVDSIAEGGTHAGQLTRGIYEIFDANHKRACWGPPRGPRPTEFDSPPGSGRILQYWTKIGPVPSHNL
jgi:uncharacterized protein (TIGR03067 family)